MRLLLNALILALASPTVAWAPVRQSRVPATVARGFLDGPSEKRKDAEVTATVFFDIEIDKEAAGRIEMGLFGGEVPQTVENFIALCEAPDGDGYKKSFFHRIIPGFMCQVKQKPVP